MDILSILIISMFVGLYYLVRLLTRIESETDKVIGLFMDAMFAMGYTDEADGLAYSFASGENPLRRYVRRKWKEWGLTDALGEPPVLLETQAVEMYRQGVEKRRSHAFYRGAWEQPFLIDSYKKMFETKKQKLLEMTGLIVGQYGHASYIGRPRVTVTRTSRAEEVTR